MRIPPSTRAMAILMAGLLQVLLLSGALGACLEQACGVAGDGCCCEASDGGLPDGCEPSHTACACDAQLGPVGLADEVDRGFGVAAGDVCGQIGLPAVVLGVRDGLRPGAPRRDARPPPHLLYCVFLI